LCRLLFLILCPFTPLFFLNHEQLLLILLSSKLCTVFKKTTMKKSVLFKKIIVTKVCTDRYEGGMKENIMHLLLSSICMLAKPATMFLSSSSLPAYLAGLYLHA
jgi:hypothetical protein